MRRSQLSVGASAEFTTETQRTQRNTESSRKTRGLKRKDAKAQRSAFKRSPASACPFGACRSVSESLGTQAYLTHRLSSGSRLRQLHADQSHGALICQNPVQRPIEPGCTRSVPRPRSTTDMSLLMKVVLRRPRAAAGCGTGLDTGAVCTPTFASLRLCAFALNSFLSGDRKGNSPAGKPNAAEDAEQLKSTSVLSFSVSSVPLWFKCYWFDPTTMRESAA